MRKKSALKNIVSKMIYSIVITLLSFVSRRVFVSTLGDTLLGLNGLLTSVISMLSLMELGVGNAIYFSLYEPLAENNEERIKSIMRLYQKLYRYIGLAVCIVGLCVIPFLKFLITQDIDYNYVYKIYLIFLANSVMSYFMAYRRSLYSANQKDYLINNVTTVVNIISYSLQIITMLRYQNYVVYLLIQVIATVSINLIFLLKSDRDYPYLREKNVQPLPKEYKDTLVKNVKALFMMSISGFAVFGTDNMLLTYFVGLGAVTIYGNYTTIINMVNTTFNSMLSNMKANVGNYLVTETKEKSYTLFKNLFFINFLITGFTSVATFTLASEFIKFWMGEKYVWSIWILAVLVFNMFSRYILEAAGVFINGAGMYNPYPLYKYISLIEGGINLVVSIFLCKVLNFGVFGVFLETSVSTIANTIAMPGVVYHHIFHKKIGEYYLLYAKYLILTVAFAAVSYGLFLFVHTPYTILNLVLGALISIGVMAAGVIVVFGRTEEFHYVLETAKGFIKRRK